MFDMGKGRTGARRINNAVVFGLALCVWPAGNTSAIAQTNVPLVEFTNVWRYEASGADLGTAWLKDDFDDSTWPIGRGLFYVGETMPYPAPFNTELPPLNGRITQYFRTRFSLPTEFIIPGLQLVATNLVDDGCVIYLNGIEAGRIRMVSQPSFQTLATNGPAVEGQFDPVNLNTALIRPGENDLAVEVHQNLSSSIDVVFGLRLVARVPQPLAITSQPLGSTNEVRATVTLAVGLSGQPFACQWQKDGTNVPGATNPTLTFTANATSQSGDYKLVVTNFISNITSDVARVTIVPDRTGLVAISAVVNSPGTTNNIFVTFSEGVGGSSVAPSAFRLLHRATQQPVNISNAVATARFVRLTVGGAAWRPFDDYILTINDVKDPAGNGIAPDTQLPVGWWIQTNVVSIWQRWLFHNASLLDPDIYNEDWTSPDYQPNPYWQEGSGVFHEAARPPPCPLPVGTELFPPSGPVLFRTSFYLPNWYPTTAVLNFLHVYSDRATCVYYLNGREIFRNDPTVIIEFIPRCPTLDSVSVSNLNPGQNWLAASVSPGRGTSDGFYFGLELQSKYVHSLPLPPGPEPHLTIETLPANAARLSWSGSGYALESSVELTSSASYPFGPWTEVSGMANPMIVPIADSFRAYRLRRK